MPRFCEIFAVFIEIYAILIIFKEVISGEILIYARKRTRFTCCSAYAYRRFPISGFRDDLSRIAKSCGRERANYLGNNYGNNYRIMKNIVNLTFPVSKLAILILKSEQRRLRRIENSRGTFRRRRDAVRLNLAIQTVCEYHLFKPFHSKSNLAECFIHKVD